MPAHVARARACGVLKFIRSGFSVSKEVSCTPGEPGEAVLFEMHGEEPATTAASTIGLSAVTGAAANRRETNLLADDSEPAEVPSLERGLVDTRRSAGSLDVCFSSSIF